MPYTVVWREAALDTLMDFWLSSIDRDAVTRAVEQVDRLLRMDPDSCGEKYYGDRLLVVDLFSVTFRVSVDDQMVEVLDIWHR